MRNEILPNGNLALFTEGPGDQDMLESILDNPHCSSEHQQLADLLDQTGWAGNSVLQSVLPEEIGALTDAVILTDNRIEDEHGGLLHTGKVWWFPDYAIRSFLEELLHTGKSVFAVAP